MKRFWIVLSIGLITIFLFSVFLGSCGPKEKAKLSILTFQGYAEDDWVKPFEEKYNAIVEVTYIGTVEEAFTKTKAAPDQYNIVSIDSGRVKMYYDAGLIQAIDVSKLENFGKMGEFFRTHPYAVMEPG